MRERSCLRERIGVNGKNVFVRKIEAYRVVPVAVQFVFPVPAGIVELYDQCDFRRLFTLEIRCWARIAPRRDREVGVHARRIGVKARTNKWLKHGSCLIASLETGDIYRTLVRAYSQGARGVSEKAHDF